MEYIPYKNSNNIYLHLCIGHYLSFLNYEIKILLHGTWLNADDVEMH